jgi:branched-chain amino acid aminotransferase
MPQSIQDFHDDPRNDAIRIYVNGALKPRAEALVSVFDSGFVLGDGVWEGLRVHRGHPAFLDQHLDRLYEGAQAIALDVGLDRDQLTRALYDTLGANAMTDGVHVRLMVTRGWAMTTGSATIAPHDRDHSEHKTPKPGPWAGARCSPSMSVAAPHCRTPSSFARGSIAYRHSSRRRRRRRRGADIDPQLRRDVQLDAFFIVRKASLNVDRRPCLGASRAPTFSDSARCRDRRAREEFQPYRRLRRQAFVTGTFAGIAPVSVIDGVKSGGRGPMVERVQQLYLELVERDVAARGARATK